MESKKIFLFTDKNTENIGRKFKYYVHKTRKDIEQRLEVIESSDCVGGERELDFITAGVKTAWKSLFLLSGDFLKDTEITHRTRDKSENNFNLDPNACTSYNFLLAWKCCIAKNRLTMVVVLFDCAELLHKYEFLDKVTWRKINAKFLENSSAAAEEFYFSELYECLKSEPKYFNKTFPAGNLAVGMAYSHFFGFLKLIVPGVDLEIKKYCKEHNISSKNFPCKYYELLPETCAIQEIVKDENGIINYVDKLKFADSGRKFEVSIYTIEDGGETFYCLCGYPSVIGSVFLMDKEEYIDISKEEQQIFLQRYYQAIKNLVNNPDISQCYGKHKMLPYNESCTGPRQVLLAAIKRDVQSGNEKNKAKRNPIMSLNSTESVSTEYDVHLIYFDDTREKAYAVEECFVKEKIKILLDDQTKKKLIFNSLEEELDNSRWVVIFLTKHALMDEMVQIKCICAVNKTLTHRRLNIIPIVDGTEMDELPEFLHQSNYIDWNDKYYLEKLRSTITGDDIQLKTKMPVYDLASGLAWGFVINFLRFTLPCLPTKLHEALDRHGQNNILCPQKEYFICPKSCKFTKILSEIDKDLVKMETKLMPVKFDQGGAKGRQYDYGNFYRVQGSNREYLVLASIPRPYAVLGIIAEVGEAGLSHVESNKQAKKLCEELKKIVETYPRIIENKVSCCEMVFFDDSVEKLSDVLARHAENDQKDLLSPSASQPSASQPSASQPTESLPSAFQPTESQPTESQPSAFQPTESQPSAFQPTESQPSAFQPSASQPSAFQPTESQPSAFQPMSPPSAPQPMSPTASPSEFQPMSPTVLQSWDTDRDQNVFQNDFEYQSISAVADNSPDTDHAEQTADVTKPSVKTCNSIISNPHRFAKYEEQLNNMHASEGEAVIQTESECSSIDIINQGKSDGKKKMVTNLLQHKTIQHLATQSPVGELESSCGVSLHENIDIVLLIDEEAESKKQGSESGMYSNIFMKEKSDASQETEMLSDIENEDFLTVPESVGDLLRKQIRESETRSILQESPNRQSDAESEDDYYDTEESNTALDGNSDKDIYYDAQESPLS